MQKFASADVLSKALVPTGLTRHARRTFAHRHHFNYDVKPGYLYVRSRAISSRCNDNFDEFPADELDKSYRTFIGKPVFVNHNNENHKRARGVVIDAVLHKDANRDGSKDHWVEVLMEVDAQRFPRLAKEILNGNIARTSMGCDVAYSVCSACNNKATSPAEYCQHIPAAKGQRLYRTTASGHKEGVLIRETCYGLKFFENSLLVEPPADPTAHFLGVDSRGLEMNSAKDPRFAEVGMGVDEEGHYVKTHRARSDSYETPEDIPQAEVDRIAATGARKTAARRGSADEDNLYSVTGCHHTSCGRTLAHRVLAAELEPYHPKRMDRAPEPSGEPVSQMLQGARGYAGARGLGELHEADFGGVRTNADRLKRLGMAYDALPHYDPKAEGAFHDMRQQVNDQYHHLTRTMGIKVEPTHEDPYADHEAMAHDLVGNRRLKVLATEATGPHPFFSNEENDRFRAVHDAFGHAVTGRGFDRHGEEAAWLAHSRMFDGPGRRAMTTETRGQNASLIGNGTFRPQKVALLPEALMKRDAHKLAYGETRAPEDVDTLREDSCPVCGDRDTYDGTTCSVCGYVAPPSIFQDPDLGVARQMDLRKDIADFTGQPGMPVDPDQLGPDGQVDPQAGPAGMDQTGQTPPGTLPGEVTGEVQPGGDGTPMDQPGLGNGIPDSDGMVPQVPGQTMTPDQLGPDGQPTQLPGDVVLGPDGQPMQQPVTPQMLGPDGQPIGPQPLPGAAMSGDGQPFHPGPNMPQGPGGPEQPEGPISPDMLGPGGQMPPTGQQPDPTAGGGAPGTPGDGVPDLSCPACGFSTDATPPTSVDMDTSLVPPSGMATPDGVQAGDVCPNCGQGLLMSPAEVTGDSDIPQPGMAVPGA